MSFTSTNSFIAVFKDFLYPYTRGPSEALAVLLVLLLMLPLLELITNMVTSNFIILFYKTQKDEPKRNRINADYLMLTASIPNLSGVSWRTVSFSSTVIISGCTKVT